MNMTLRGHPSLPAGEDDLFTRIASVKRHATFSQHEHVSARAEIYYVYSNGRYYDTYVHAQETLELRPRFRE